MQIQEIIENKDLLREEITKTNGLFLLKLKKDGFLPDISVLLEILNPIVASFVVSNYETNDEQKEKVLPFLNDQGKEDLLGKDITFEKVEKMLKAGINLPKTAKINKELFIKYEDELIKQLDDNYYNIKGVVFKFLSALEKEDVMKLTPKLASHDPSLIAIKSQWFEDDVFSKYYKDLVLEKEKNHGERLRLSDFKYYHFKDKDKKFLKKLINGSYSVELDEIKSLKGAFELLDKEWYFNEYDFKKLELYSVEEIKKDLELKDKIQNKWISLVDSVYRPFNALYRLKVPMSKYKELINDEFMEKAYQKIVQLDPVDGVSSINFEYVDKDFKEGQEKDFWNRARYCDLIVKKSREGDLAGLESYTEQVDYILNEKHYLHNIKWVEDETKRLERESTEYIIKYLIQWTQSDTFFKAASRYKNGTNFITRDVANFFIKNKEKTTPNLLWLALKESYSEWGSRYRYNDKKKSISKEDSIGLVKSIVENLSKSKQEKQVAIEMLDFYISLSTDDRGEDFKGSLISIKKLVESWSDNLISLKAGIKNEKFDVNNFVLYDKKNINKIKEEVEFLVFELNKEYRNDLLKSKDLMNKGLMSYLENNSDRESIKEYLIKYINSHKEKIDESSGHLSIIKSSIRQKELYPNFKSEDDNKVFDLMLEKIKERVILEKTSDLARKGMKESGYSRKDFGLSEIKNWDDFVFSIPSVEEIEKMSQNQKNELFANCNEKKEVLFRKVQELKGSIATSLFEDRMALIIKEKNFELFDLIERETRGAGNSKKMFCEYVNNLDFESLKEFLKDKSFVKRVLEYKEYDKKYSDIKFNNFTEKENVYIVKKLMRGIKEGYSKTQVFAYFNDSNRNFIKKFVIEEMPLEIVSSYDLRGSEMIRSQGESKYIQENYTKEEYYQIYTNLKKQTGTYFPVTQNVNARYYDLIESMFQTGWGDSDKNKKKALFDKYMELLEDLKNKDPLLYIMSFRESCIEGLLEDRKGTKDEGSHDFFLKYMDFDKVMLGLKEVASYLKNDSEKIDFKNANALIHNMIFATYYSEYVGSSMKEEKKSKMNEEQSLEFFRFLAKEAPGFLFYCSTVGTLNLNNAGDILIDKAPDLITWDFVENMLYPHRNINSEYSNISADNWQGKRVLEIFEAIAVHAMNVGDKEILENLVYNLETHNFLNNKANSDGRYQLIPEGRKDGVISLLAEDSGFSNVLKTIKLKMDLQDEIIRENVQRRVAKISKI